MTPAQQKGTKRRTSKIKIIKESVPSASPLPRPVPKQDRHGVLKGDVDILGLANLLQILAMNGRQGVLTLYQDLERKSIYFEPRGIRLLSTTLNRLKPLGKILLRNKVITKEELQKILTEQNLVGWKFGKIAVTMGAATVEEVREAMREQIEEEIFDMFMWVSAAFEFREGTGHGVRPDNPLSSLVFDQNITSIMLEATRRADEFRRIRERVHEGMVLARTVERIPQKNLEADAKVIGSILPLINGQNTVQRIVASSLYPRFATMRALYLLIANSYVAPVVPAVPRSSRRRRR